MSISCSIDLNQVSHHKVYTLNATPSECSETAQRLMVPKLHNIRIAMTLSQHKSHWTLSGTITSDMQLKCTATSKLFDATIAADFDVILSNHEPSDAPDNADVELLTSSQINLSEIALQYLALETPLSPLYSDSTEAPATANELSTTHANSDAWKQALAKLKN